MRAFFYYESCSFSGEDVDIDVMFSDRAQCPDCRAIRKTKAVQGGRTFPYHKPLEAAPVNRGKYWIYNCDAQVWIQHEAE